MSIANELSSDVAAAVLAHSKPETHTDAQGLINILLHFHSTLRALTVEERRRRLRSHINGTEPVSSLKRAAFGN